MFGKSIFIVAVTLAMVLAGQAQAPATMKLQRIDIMDNQGFDVPVRFAVTVLPADWKTEGGIVWDVRPDSCVSGSTFAWQAQSPDEKITIARLPSMGWKSDLYSGGWSRVGGCVDPGDGSPESLSQQYLTSILGQNVRITSVESDPAVDQVMMQQVQAMNYSTPDTRQQVSALIRGVAFEGVVQGEQVKGLMISPVIYTTMTSQFASYQSGQLIAPIIFATSPDQFDQVQYIFDMFMKNYQEDPAWKMKKWQSDAEFRRNNPRPSSTWQVDTTGSDILDMQMGSWRRQNAMTDTGQARSVDAIRGVTAYRADTPNGVVRLPSGYDRTFQTGSDTFVVTNDAFLQPDTATGYDPAQLEKAY